MTEALPDLDRRIVAALQADGRASWSTIARVLDEPLRTVSRRGKELLESGVVEVIGLHNLGPTCVIEITCRPSRTAELAAELSQHPGVVYAIVLANPSSLLIEVHEQAFDLSTMTLEVIPSYDGVLEVSATPVLRYFKTNADWRPPILTGAEAHQLDEVLQVHHVEESTGAVEELDGPDSAIIAALEQDGRTGVAELAQVAGVTEPTARKRLADLQERGALATRVIVDPLSLGYDVETCVRISCAPEHIDLLGEMLAAVPESRYVAQLLGSQALIAHFNARDLPHVRQLLGGEWTRYVRAIHPSLTTLVAKRSGRILTKTLTKK
ncbi:Lrp/AsnC family transcriptional regulator [Leucobacter sp. cx-42]|uniref:Lrp/AsnC family transcriptional regulator n=1 Tax=unclassified Leucobacter TaxID=2621730 RepID=UPI00165DF821|nr:Lrp/AsnC family transcriptional regulator [Leucobacter sp. cx-42]